MPSSKDDGVCNEEQFALELLKTELTDLFKQKEEVRREAQEMTKWLSRFPYSYHVSDYAAKGSSQIQRKWFAGLANLEFTSSGNLSGYFVMGEKTLKVFGRPIPHNKNRTLWHLQWRGVDERSESGSTSMVVKKSDLEFGETLLGSWVGRSSWTADDVRPSGGPFILHSQPNLRPKDLERLVTSLQDEYLPDLRRLSDEMVSIPSDESPESIQGARNPRLTKRPKAR